MNEITKAEMRKKLANITQLRELLLGDKVDKYDSQLEQYHLRLEKLELNLQQSQTAISNSIAQLESKLLQRIEAIAKILVNKTSYHNLKAQEKHEKLQQELDTLANYSYENIDSIQKDLNLNTSSLKIEIAQAKLDLNQDLDSFKQQLSGKFEEQLLELEEGKISRTDLADVLFEMCLKLKGTDIDSDSINELETSASASNLSSSDLMLPEKN